MVLQLMKHLLQQNDSNQTGSEENYLSEEILVLREIAQLLQIV
jgi:hypothetical protein